MAVRKKARRSKRARGSSGKGTPASSSASAPDPSSVASLTPDDADAAGVGDQPDDADGAGAAPPLPPDPGAEGDGDAGDERERERSSARAADAELEERERRKRCAVLAVVFVGVFAAMPPKNGGGALSEDEASTLAEAWELPLRPYWDTIMGPWIGALMTTVAVIAPRAMAARAKLRAAGVAPDNQVG